MRNLALATLLLLAMPLAAAELTLSAEGDLATPLVPDVDLRTITLTVTLDCQSLWESLGTDDQIEASLAVTMPTGYGWNGLATFPMKRESCPTPLDSTPSWEHPITVWALDAPAEVPHSMEATVSAAGEEKSQTLSLETAWYGLLALEGAESVVQLRGTTDYNLTLENRGNAPARVVGELVELPKGFRVALPQNLILEAGERREILVQLEEASSGWEQSSAVLRFQPESTMNPELQGPAVDIHVLVKETRAQASEDSPGPAALPLLVGALLWFRFQRARQQH